MRRRKPPPNKADFGALKRAGESRLDPSLRVIIEVDRAPPAGKGERDPRREAGQDDPAIEQCELQLDQAILPALSEERVRGVVASVSVARFGIDREAAGQVAI